MQIMTSLIEELAQETDLNFLRQIAIQQAIEMERMQEEIDALEAQIVKLIETGDPTEVQRLQEMLDLLKRQKYGRLSERHKKDKPATEPKPKQPGHGPREQPELKQVVVEDVQPPDQMHCPQCGQLYELLGDEAEESILINFITRQFIQELHLRRKYRCRCNETVITAPGPLRLRAGGLYSPGFAVEIALQKYEFHQPLERQVQAMKQDGLRMDTQTLFDQLDYLATALTPTYEMIMAEILKQPRILADETRWELLANGHVKENKRCYAWCLVAEDLVGYRILDDHSQDAGRLMLQDYHGIVMADGYAVYIALAKPPDKNSPPIFILAHCWSHVRRKFLDVKKHHP